MEQRKHLWNGRWGRLARRDIFLREDGGRWYIEDRRGGAEGTSTWFDYDDEDAALDRIGVLMNTSDGWSEINASRRG